MKWCVDIVQVTPSCWWFSRSPPFRGFLAPKGTNQTMFRGFLRSSTSYVSSFSSRFKARCAATVTSASNFANISLRSRPNPVKSLISRYMNALDRYPVRVKMVQSLVIAAVGDILAQKLTMSSSSSSPSSSSPSSSSSSPQNEEATVPHANALDWRRTGALSAYAFVWSGPFAHFWFNAAEKLVTSKGWSGVVKKVFLDQFVIGPPCTLLFFVAVGALEGHGRAKIEDNVQKNLLRTQLACWSVWPAIHMVTFSVIPVPLRPLFSGAMSVLWSGFVSWSLHHKHPEKLVEGCPEELAAPQTFS